MPINKESWLGRLFLKDKGTKALSILLAVTSWYSIRGVIGVTRTLHGIPIDIRVREGMAVVPESDNTVSVTFKGSEEDLALLEEAHLRGQIRAVVMAKAKDAPGKETVGILARNIEGTKGSVRAIKVKPGSLTVKLDKESEERFLVRPNVGGEPGIGHVSSVVCDPSSVWVRGPKEEIDKLRSDALVVYTEKIDVDGVSESFTRSARILQPKDIWTGKIEPSDVAVSVTIERQPAVKTWSGIPVLALTWPSSARVAVRPDTVSLTLTGSGDTLENVTTNDFRIFADCQTLEPSVSNEVPLTVHLLHDLHLSAAVNPAKVEVTLIP